MFNRKFVGVPMNLLAWALLAVSVGFMWYLYAEILKVDGPLKGVYGNTLVEQAESLSLAIAIMTTLALIGLTTSIAGYTFTEKILNVNRVAMFTLEWILIAVSVALIWSISKPSEVDDNVHLVPAITATLALVLYTGYFMMEARGMKTGKKSKK